MHKILLHFGFVCFLLFSSSSFAARVLVELDVDNKPTQRVEAGDREVQVLSFRVKTLAESEEDVNSPIYFKGLNISREGMAAADQILRYKLIKDDGTILKRVSLPGGNMIVFDNLNYQIGLNESEVFMILADLSYGESEGSHQFLIQNREDLLFSEKEFSENMNTEGVFPITANRILIGSVEEAPVMIEEDELEKEAFIGVCNLREEPVCGVDFKTYFNRCFSFNKGVDVLYEGVCEVDKFKAMELEKEAALCENQEQNLVCGRDGITYDNACFLSKNEIFLAYQGACFPAEYEEPQDLPTAVDLFRRKKEELKQVKPRMDERVLFNLDSIEIELSNFEFEVESHDNLIRRITDFLKFSSLNSSGDRFFQELELVRISVIEAKQLAAKTRYSRGEIPFLDVDVNQWYFEYVQFLKDKNWVHGYLNKAGENIGVFNPSGSITKAEITKMALNVANFSDQNLVLEVFNPLKNTKVQDHWARDLVELSENANFSLWKSFSNPSKKASRAEVVALVLESFGVFPRKFETTDFSDVSKSHEYFNAINTAYEFGIISGYPDGSFKPNQTVTRAEASKILTNSFKIFSFDAVNWDTKLEDLEFYGLDYNSNPHKFSMKIPGLFKFSTFDAQQDGEIVRYGFTYMGKDSDMVDFWLSIQDNYNYIESKEVTQEGNLVGIKIPDAANYHERYFLIEGPTQLMPVMEFFANSLK